MSGPGNGSLGSSDTSCGLSPSDASPSTSGANGAVPDYPILIAPSRKRPASQKEPDPDAIKMFVGQVPMPPPSLMK